MVSNCASQSEEHSLNLKYIPLLVGVNFYYIFKNIRQSPVINLFLSPSNDLCSFSLGGWTLIAQTVFRNSTSFSPMVREKNFRMIQNYSSGIVRVDVTAIWQLKQLIHFTQLRYFCHKKSTGRIFHIMTKRDSHGERALRYLTEDPSVQPRACGSFETLPDDNSFLAANCAKWGNDGVNSECNKWGYYKNKGNYRIYNDPIIWEGKYYINLKPSILACDDSRDMPHPLSPGDKWQMYVR